MDVAVVTAIFGGKDNCREPHYTDGFPHYCVTDDPKMDGLGVWTIVHRERRFEDPVRDARRVKILSHDFHHEYVIWVDGNAALTQKPMTLINQLSEDIGASEHPEKRDCCHDEVQHCKKINKDYPDVLDRAAEFLENVEMPRHWGLWQTGTVVRRHTPRVIRFNKLWWSLLMAGSRRDQIYFPYCSWLLNEHIHTYGTIFTHKPHNFKKNPTDDF